MIWECELRRKRALAAGCICSAVWKKRRCCRVHHGAERGRSRSHGEGNPTRDIRDVRVQGYIFSCVTASASATATLSKPSSSNWSVSAGRRHSAAAASVQVGHARAGTGVARLGTHDAGGRSLEARSRPPRKERPIGGTPGEKKPKPKEVVRRGVCWSAKSRERSNR